MVFDVGTVLQGKISGLESFDMLVQDSMEEPGAMVPSCDVGPVRWSRDCYVMVRDAAVIVMWKLELILVK